jgi:hypothetical protein
MADAGQLACASFGVVSSVDTRLEATSILGQTQYDTGDIAYDPVGQVILIEAYGVGVPDCLLEFDPVTGQFICVGVMAGGGLAFSGSGFLEFLHRNAEFFPPGNYYLSIDPNSRNIIGIDTLGGSWPVAPFPPAFSPMWNAVAWDNDLNLIWLLSLDPTLSVALNPTDFSVVAWSGLTSSCLAATTGIDDVPAQTPELFISGTCPGELTVSVADATPGSNIQLASGTRAGRRTVPSGPCAGTRTDLANPRPRATLVADAFGLATTYIQATDPMCGQWMLQALDEDSCLTTAARRIPDLVVP